ncbi:unnamed protein product, partial [Ascophyllum nodosum]
KYKCRLVAQGFRQIKDIHYDESSSPTRSQASIRMVLGIAAVKNWELRQLDVDMAYLEANVKEELHIELPEDYRNSCGEVGRLQKAMYGLVHAGLLWSKTFSAELAAEGFEQCQADPYVFRRVLRGNVVVNIVVYVDDLLVASETKCDEEQAMNDLRSCFSIKDLGEAGFYLGCALTRDRDAGTMKFDQHHYVRSMASKSSVEKTSTTPAVTGAKPLSNDDAPQTEAETEEMRVTPYRKALGAIMWTVTMNLPDIAYAAHQIGKFNDNPGPAYWRAAKRALQYLWRTEEIGI